MGMARDPLGRLTIPHVQFSELATPAESPAQPSSIQPGILKAQPSKRQLKSAIHRATSSAPWRAATPAEASSPPLPCPATGLASSSTMQTDNNALVGGVWQTDSSQHTLDGRLKGRDTSHGTVRVPARNGQPTLRVAYFFSGVERKASIADYLSELCKAEGFGLEFHEIDTLVGARTTIC